MGKAVYGRAYYHCSHCGHGHFPTDAELKLASKFSLGAREVIALMGVLEPFQTGVDKLLPKFCGLRVSASTIQRITERAGEDVARQRAAGTTFGPDTVWDWNRDAAGKTVGYIGLDATSVPQQGPHGERAEGRMPWVATVFNPQPMHEDQRRHRIWETRYVSGLMSLPEIGRQLRQECVAVGLEQVDTVVALSDGGHGLENCLTDSVRGLFRELVFILDFYHVREHLTEFAKILRPSDEAARKQQLEKWCHTLKHAGGRALFEQLQAYDVSTETASVQKGLAGLLGYLRNNLHRMDYPRYVSRGWQIGSGKVESACKTVVCRRMKEGGMRWREPATTALAQLRALHRSEIRLWNNFWTQHAAG